MKSPFPGMDPYLEQHWGDVHATFMVYARNQLNKQLPHDLQARVEEALAVEVDDSLERFVYADVQVVEKLGSPFELDSAPADVAVAEPTEIVLSSEAPTQRHIEIIDAGSGNRVVTAIELLSPANKKGKSGPLKYLKKQSQYLQTGVNLVEIDLLRFGKFVLAIPEERWPRIHKAPYKICVRRVQRPGFAAVLGIRLQDRLPNIRIPLRPTDADVVLRLQPIIDDCYVDGRYGGIDYSEPPVPPPRGKVDHWADQLLREQKRR